MAASPSLFNHLKKKTDLQLNNIWQNKTILYRQYIFQKTPFEKYIQCCTFKWLTSSSPRGSQQQNKTSWRAGGTLWTHCVRKSKRKAVKTEWEKDSTGMYVNFELNSFIFTFIFHFYIYFFIILHNWPFFRLFQDYTLPFTVFGSNFCHSRPTLDVVPFLIQTTGGVSYLIIWLRWTRN